jgi:hypothetical protein
VEDKVSEPLELRPYPGIDPLPSSNDFWWGWVALLVVLVALLWWWLRRSRRDEPITPGDALKAALADSSDVTVDPIKRYARLHRCLRAYLAWAHHPRWKVLTGSEWEEAITNLWPTQLGFSQLEQFLVYWRRGEIIQFGQGITDEDGVLAYRALIEPFAFQLGPKNSEKRLPTSSAS